MTKNPRWMLSVQNLMLQDIEYWDLAAMNCVLEETIVTLNTPDPLN